MCVYFLSQYVEYAEVMTLIETIVTEFNYLFGIIDVSHIIFPILRCNDID